MSNFFKSKSRIVFILIMIAVAMSGCSDKPKTQEIKADEIEQMLNGLERSISSVEKFNQKMEAIYGQKPVDIWELKPTTESNLED